MSLLLIGAACLAIALLAAQVLLPRLGERRVRRRLTDGGGEAFVAIDAFPAWLLLQRRGDRLLVRGRRLEIGMSPAGGGLTALDGFREVDIVLSELRTGPFEIARFELRRVGAGAYRMRSEALTSGAALADFGGAQLGFGAAPLLGRVARQAPLGGRAFPVAVDVELVSVDGLLRVGAGGGSVAGYPAGRIAAALAAAVARRLEIRF
jgi:hypothetical protein